MSRSHRLLKTVEAMVTTTLPPLRTGKPRKVKELISPTNGVEIPYGIVEGYKNGPLLLITAGVHGSEVCSIEAALRLMDLDPQTFSGVLLIFPIMNIAGFQQRSIYINPLDGKNLNRQFPGNPDGTTSERIAHWLSGHFSLATAYLDLHGGDLNEELNPFTIYNEGDQSSRELAVAFGIDTVVAAWNERPTSSSTCARRGIPSITVEAGCNGIVSETNVRVHYDGVKRVMAFLGMLNDGHRILQTNISPKFVKMDVVPGASADGIWRRCKRLGDPVKVGDVLGETRDVLGNVIDTIHADRQGEVLYQVSSLWVNAGEILVVVGYAHREAL